MYMLHVNFLCYFGYPTKASGGIRIVFSCYLIFNYFILYLDSDYFLSIQFMGYIVRYSNDLKVCECKWSESNQSHVRTPELN